MTIFLICILFLASAIGAWWWSRRQTRNEILQSKLSDLHRAIIVKQVPLYQDVPSELHEALDGKINLFLHQIEFIGCNGLEVTDEMRLSIAAQACILIANSDMWYLNLSTVLVYPGAFKSRQSERHGHVVTERDAVRIGESWTYGPVVLSWAHSVQGAFVDDDGHNVVLHEFAHQLDALSGSTDGGPILGRGQNPHEWDRAFREAYDRLVNNVNAARKTFLDPYGATAPEEFFAVAVESFFERSVALKQAEPEVYEQLSALFNMDPSTWR